MEQIKLWLRKQPTPRMHLTYCFGEVLGVEKQYKGVLPLNYYTILTRVFQCELL